MPQKKSSAHKSKVGKLAGLLQRAENGDRTALTQVRKILDLAPGIWEETGDIAGHAINSLVRVAASDNLLLKDSLERKLAALKDELAGQTPTPLERLLAERIAAYWLQVHFADAMCTQNTKGVSREWGAISSDGRTVHTGGICQPSVPLPR